MINLVSISETSHRAASVRILIADRLALFRHGVMGLLREARPDWACIEAATAEQLHRRIADAHVLVIDLRMPGLGSLKQFRQQHPGCRIVAVSESDDRATILDCLSAGASAYLLRDATPAQFLHALDTTRAGGVYAPDALANPTVNVTAAPSVSLPQLTERQRDVFQLLVEGCATKTIARRLDLGVGTVKVHLAAIYRTVGAHSRLEAVAKMQRQFAMG